MHSWTKNKKFWFIFLGIFFLYVLYRFFSSASHHPGIAVEVAPVTQINLSPHFEGVGNVEADNSVTIKPQISGQLTQIPVNPGQEVKQNDLLFVIDPRPFQAKVDQAKATLQKDQALANNASSDLARYVKLLKKGYISHEYFDQLKSTAESSKATVDADQAALKTAELQLEYTQIRAPMSGRLSDINPNVGDIVTPSDTNPLTTLNQFKPMDAAFSLPAQNLPTILQANAKAPLSAIATPDADKTYHAQGQLSFIDNQINQTTGTVAMKATFPNEDERLWPGQFVRVSVNLPSIPHALMIPTLAIQQNQQQKYYVYIVDAKDHARMRMITLGASQNDQTNVLAGLALGEKVITKGQFEITDGSLVAPTEIR